MKQELVVPALCNSKRLDTHDGAPGIHAPQYLIAGAALACLWIGLVTFGWSRWGSVTVDSGRELYVAAVLAQGKMLYRDVWYSSGPGAPYLNALLFRIFGIHLAVAQLAGGLAALAVALTLFHCARYFVSLPIAAALGYIVLVQSFGPGIFSYPLPYSYASVYGSVAASFFLLYAIRAALDPRKADVFRAAIWSAVALLMKLEYGVACFATLAVLQIGLILRQRSWRATIDNLLVILPALLICAVTIAWMVSIRGVSFITEENFTSWPTSYFMRTYGQLWLGGQGFELSLENLASALLVTIGFVTFWAAFRLWLRTAVRGPAFLNIGFSIVAGAGAIVFWMIRPEQLGNAIADLVFPPPMVFIVALAAPLAAFQFWRHNWRARGLAIVVITTFGPLLGVRILFKMLPQAYAIFYNGPVLLAFYWLLFSIAIPADARGHPRVRKTAWILCAVLCSWVTVQVYPDYREMRKRRVAVKSERGTIYLPETMLPAWAEAVDFMRQAKAIGESVMSIPEDTGLYFFSGALCPIRVCIFHPGLVAPGPMMNEVIAAMEQARVRYIIWSNRKFYEYGVSEFGVDFDVPLGRYIRNSYRPVRRFGPSNPPDGWHAVLWERKMRRPMQD